MNWKRFRKQLGVVIVLLVTVLFAAAAVIKMNKVALTNSTIDSTTIGATTPSTGAFTTLSATSGLSHTLTACTQDANGPTTGTGAMLTIYSCTIPALTAGQGIEVWVSASSSSVTTCSTQLTYGGVIVTGGADSGVNLGSGGASYRYVLRTAAASTTSGILSSAWRGINASSVSMLNGGVGTFTVNMGTSQTLAFQVNCANTQTISGLSFTVRQNQ